jgi:hypothetical protein
MIFPIRTGRTVRESVFWEKSNIQTLSVTIWVKKRVKSVKKRHRKFSAPIRDSGFIQSASVRGWV